MSNLIQKKILKLNKVYSPTAPIKTESLFQGRNEQLMRIDSAVNETGQHIILYGDRGVGKTSLANIVGERYRIAINCSITCNQNSTLSGLWKGVFRRIPTSVERYKKIGFVPEENSDENIKRVVTLGEQIDPTSEIDIDDINSLLSTADLIGYKLMFIFDEFDQISDANLISDFSNIIKYCSDHLENITIMIVGIGKSVTDLIHNHQSIERSTKQILLPRMSDDELGEIIVKANSELSMTIDKKVLSNIVKYSSGYPHFTHLLGKYSTLSAIRRGTNKIEHDDFQFAINESLENANESIRNTYEKGIITSKAQSYFPQVLTACALVDLDEHGSFRLTDIKEVLKREFDLDLGPQAYQYHIGKLCTEDRGNILEKITMSGFGSRYKFQNPLLKTFVILKHYKTKYC